MAQPDRISKDIVMSIRLEKLYFTLAPYAHEIYKHQKPNFKSFDKPFDRLTVLSEVEGLTTLSQAEGQITITKIKNSTRLSSSQAKQLAVDLI